MADVCCQYTFGSLTINPTSGENTDHLQLAEDGIVGLDGAPIRRQRDPASRQNGANVFGAYLHGRVIAVTAHMVIGTVGHENGLTTAYLTAYNALEEAIKTALAAQLNTPTNLAWTPTGGSAHTLSCVYGTEDGEVRFPGPMINRLCTFTLLEATEIID